MKPTVNSPVTASKPTWMVCSKSEGREISGRSFSFFLFAVQGEMKALNHQFESFYTPQTTVTKNRCRWWLEEENHTHFCLRRERWSAGGPSCFSPQEPLEAVWMRDLLLKSLGNYCSFSREGPVVSRQYRHYQTCLVALTRSWTETVTKTCVESRTGMMWTGKGQKCGINGLSSIKRSGV